MSGLLIVPNYMPALDANGSPSSGALLYVYVNETVTLASIFSDEALATPLSNPVVAASDGSFALIYADEAHAYSTALTTSTGAQLKPSYDNVFPTISAGGTFSAANVSFIPDVPTPPTRNVQDKLEEIVSTLDIGLDPTGAVSVSTKLQAWHDALPATGGFLHLTAGTYKFATGVTFTKPIRFMSDGRGCVTFTTSMATGDVITLNGSNKSYLTGFSFTSSVTRSAGRFIYMTGCSNSTIIEFYMEKYYVGVGQDNCYICLIRECQGQLPTPETTSTGSCFVQVGKTAICGSCRYEDIFTFSDPADPNNLTKMPGAGLNFIWCDGCVVIGCDIIRSGIDCLLNPGTGKIVNGLYCLMSYFDSANYGYVISPTGTGAVYNPKNVGCWTGSNQYDGVRIDPIGGTSIVTNPILDGHHSFGNGLTAGNGVTCNFECDLQVNGGLYWANDGAGIGFAANVGKFTIDGANCTDGGTGVGNDIGVNVPAGTANDWSVTGGSVRNNVTIGLNYGGAGNNRKVWNVAGFISFQSGSFVLPSASTSVVVNHGLGSTPGIGGIIPVANTTWATSAKYWIDTITSTQFTFNVNAAPGSDTAWGYQASLSRTH